MSLEKTKGYFYNEDGDLIESYIGYLDLSNMEEVLEFRKNAVGFVQTDLVDTEFYKYNIETEQIIEK
tara:strand:+ start:17177 stop:17377 length:201 start_codon:yes stop_codon:yes gene_type:complete